MSALTYIGPPTQVHASVPYLYTYIAKQKTGSLSLNQCFYGATGSIIRYDDIHLLATVVI
jgi:hypothetical protein